MIEPGSLVRTLFHSFSVVVHSLIQKILLGKTKSHLSMFVTRKSSTAFKRLLVVFDCVLVLILVIWVVCFFDEFTTHFRNRGRTQLNRSRLLIILNIHRCGFLLRYSRHDLLRELLQNPDHVFTESAVWKFYLCILCFQNIKQDPILRLA